jgi:hypothetical protein
MKYRILITLWIFSVTYGVFAQDTAPYSTLDPNIVFALAWGMIAILFIGVALLLFRLLEAIKVSVSPEVAIAFGEQIRAVADGAIQNAKDQAAKTPTPLDDLGVMAIEIPYAELIKWLPKEPVQPIPPESPSVPDTPPADSDGELNPVE